MTSAVAPTLSSIVALAAAEERKSAVISLHDVAPLTREPSAKILHELRSLGVSRCSLLVVPNYHRMGLSFADRDFLRWLHDLENDGHEIVVHGYFHDRPRRAVETLRDRFITRVYTSDEGEFYDLSYADAFERLTRAKEEFSAAGFKTHGFIAPAWLLSDEALSAARDCEFEYTTRLTTVDDIRCDRSYRSRSLVYSVRNEWRRSVSRVWNRALFHRLAASELLRLSIHPPDISYVNIWQQIRRFAGALTHSHHLMTYGDWVARTRVRTIN